MRWLLLVTLLALPGACKSNKKAAPAATGSGSPMTTTLPTAPADAGSAAATPSASADEWNEDVAVPATASKVPYNPSFRVPAEPLPSPAEGDALIARYENECPEGPTTKPCQQLRVQVERVLLADTLALRADGQVLPLEWYRAAAGAELPQLACLGITELARAETRTSEDEAALVAAIDSPWPIVRDAVFMHERRLPAVVEKVPYVPPHAGGGVGCLGGLHDPTPGPTWSGNYPGATFRYFASSPTRRWFTTTDPLDKVLAYFAKTGHPAQTAEELSAADQARSIAEIQKVISAPHTTGESEEVQAQKLNQQVLAMAPLDWTGPYRGITNAEIRYVRLGPRQVIAVFKDDVLHATSIIAAPPPKPPSLDVDAAKRHEQLRAILNF